MAWVPGALASQADLLLAYPRQLDRFVENRLHWKDGGSMAWDDGRKDKTVRAYLDDSDLEDMFLIDYFLHPLGSEPPKGHNPGSYRHQPFFEKMYGADRRTVRARLAAVDWFGTVVYVTRINGIDEALSKVRDELRRHASYPDWERYLLSPAGGWNWRPIAGTARLSMHSFGLAFDINRRYSDYADWETKGDIDQEVAYRNQIPVGIVEIFERHCFAWGGRKYWFDTMHFEYRPELLPGCERAGD